jgi:hypothetical protein
MVGLGFGISLVSGRPRLFAVRAKLNGDKIEYQSVLEHWAAQAEDDVQQLRNLAAKVETLLVTESADAVVIRRMDWTGTVKREVVAKRGRAEGVVGAVVRAKIAACRFATGQEIANLCGSTKAAVEADAKSVFGDDQKVAVAAARAALAWAQQQG